MEEQLINKKYVALDVAENDRRPALGKFWIGVLGRLQDGRCHDVIVRTAKERAQMAKTYNSGDLVVVTHLTTNPPVSCLYMAERTGSLAFTYATAIKFPDFPLQGIINGICVL